MTKRNILLVIAGMCFASSLALADEIQIPYGVYMDEFKAECKLKGLDLENTRASQGFVNDRANEFSVFTYKTATPEQLDLIREVSLKHRRA